MTEKDKLKCPNCQEQLSLGTEPDWECNNDGCPVVSVQILWDNLRQCMLDDDCMFALGEC